MKALASKLSPARFVLLAMVALVLPGTAYGSASMSLQPSSWDFGSREPGSGPSEPVTFTLTNTGDVVLSLYVTGVGWANADGAVDPDLFAAVENNCSELGVLAPNANCTLGVTFNPSAPGPKLGMVSLSANAGAPISAKAELTGMGTGPFETPNAPGFPTGLLSSEDASVAPAPASLAQVVLIRHPKRKTTEQSAEFAFRATPTGSFVCTLDGRPKAACRSPLRFQGLRIGSHRIVIRAINAEGVMGPPTRFHWLVQKKI